VPFGVHVPAYFCWRCILGLNTGLPFGKEDIEIIDESLPKAISGERPHSESPELPIWVVGTY